MNKAIASQRLRYFTVLWALVGLMEQMDHGRSWFFMPTDQIFIAAIVFALCFSEKLAALIFLAGAGLVHLFLATTNSLNNIAFESLINFTILMVTGLSFVNKETWGIENNDIYQKIAPIIRIFLVAYYFFAFFTKINRDFLNPNFSCAVKAVDQFLKVWFGASQASWLKPVSVWVALLVEILLPVMLVFKKTRNIAIIDGLFFHFILGFMAWVWGFSVLMGVLYFVFLPEQSFYLIQGWGEKFISIIKKVIPNKAIRITLLTMLVYGGVSVGKMNVYKIFGFWLAVYFIIMSVFILSVLLSKHQRSAADQTDEGSYFLPRPRFLLVLAVPLFISGFAPFLGLRTMACITPFSNLRTLGPKPNHLILGPSFVIFKQDMVKILGSNNRRFQYYAKNHYLLTEYEFRQIANAIHGTFYVRCIYQGEDVVINKIDDEPDDSPLFEPVPWVEQKFIRFEPIDELDHCRCQEGFTGIFPRKNPLILQHHLQAGFVQGI